ncbi:MAG: GIY-YIG nuclease family protein [Alphaproteobacteria bacterium]|nr:GIY-YIG nuclease family protein [Alphaproteobacteria bacterium]
MTEAFLTKVWGIGFDKLPILGFSTEGGRLNFLKSSKPGDWVYVVGTKTTNTPEELRGRILARLQLGRDLFNARTVIEAAGYQPSERELDEARSYKWPFALPVLRLEYVDGQPSLTDVIGDFNDGSHFATYALSIREQVGPVASDKLLALDTSPGRVPSIPAIDNQRAHQDHQSFKSRLNGRSGPGPSSTPYSVEREEVGGYTYLFRLIDRKHETNFFKIGYAVDWQRRLNTLNKGLFSPVTGCSFKIVTYEPFEQLYQAYNTEQHLLLQFRDDLVEGEHEVVQLQDETEVQRAIFEICRSARFLEPPAQAPRFEIAVSEEELE